MKVLIQKRFFALLLLSFLFFSCELLQIPRYETWEHEIVAANYSTEGALYKYTYEDERFNESDWFDVYMDDSYWDSSYGWSHFDSVYDSGVFYFQPVYYEGYVEWYAYGEDIVGATLRFSKLSY